VKTWRIYDIIDMQEVSVGIFIPCTGEITATSAIALEGGEG
jgi:hypothetical protein